MKPITYMTSLLTFYLKGEIKQEQNFINIKRPNTILALIPLGAKKESLPVNHLSSVESDFKLNFKRLLSGLVFVIIAFAIFTSSFIAGLFVLAIGANAVITSFETELTIKTTSGDIKNIPFLIFEKSKAELAESQIRQLVSNRLDDTNMRQQADKIVDAINNK